MKTIVTALAILGVAVEIAAIESVQAADLKDPFDTPRYENYEAPTSAFIGFGIGIDGGGQFNATQLNCPDEDCGEFQSADGISSDGLIGGAHAEYLFAAGRLRFGAYGEGGFSNVNTDIEFNGGNFDLLKQDSYYGAGLKAGVTVYGNTLLYVRGGYDWSQWTFGDAIGEDTDADVGSWLIGAGVDTMVSDNWSIGLGVDYLIVDDVEAADQDLSEMLRGEIFDDSEMLRAKVRLTRRW